MAVEDEIYDRLMDWARQTFNTGRDDLMNFQYEVQQQGLGELVDSLMAEAWDEGYGLGVEVGHHGDDYWESNPYRKLIENDS